MYLIMTTRNWGTRFQERVPHCLFSGTLEEARAYCKQLSGHCPGMYYVVTTLPVICP